MADGNAPSGFTLVEVMIALFIFGLLAAGGVALLSFSVRAQAAGGRKLDDIAALDRTIAILSADAAQAVDRPARDEGGALLPAFSGAAGAEVTPMLRFVRAGWSNLDGAARPGLQKVAYRVENGAFERLAYPQLDGAAALPPAVLLTHVKGAALRYRFHGAWSDRWDGAAGADLPQVIELTLARDDGTSTRALFLVGAGYAPQEAGTGNGA